MHGWFDYLSTDTALLLLLLLLALTCVLFRDQRSWSASERYTGSGRCNEVVLIDGWQWILRRRCEVQRDLGVETGRPVDRPAVVGRVGRSIGKCDSPSFRCYLQPRKSTATTMSYSLVRLCMEWRISEEWQGRTAGHDILLGIVTLWNQAVQMQATISKWRFTSESRAEPRYPFSRCTGVDSAAERNSPQSTPIRRQLQFEAMQDELSHVVFVQVKWTIQRQRQVQRQR